jgi:CarD family transcriptional regulator
VARATVKRLTARRSRADGRSVPSRSYAERLSVAVGDTVVYGAHGVGSVVAQERRVVAGAERDCIVVNLAEGLRVTLAVEEAAERLRPLIDDGALANVQYTLADKRSRREGSWTKRINQGKAKLAAGNPVDLAQIVRDGACFERPANGLHRLSNSERLVYVRARQLLVREISSARGIEQEEADAWIEAQIALHQEGEG